MTNENSILLNYPHVPFFYHELLEPLKNSIGKCRCNLYLILLIMFWNTSNSISMSSIYSYNYGNKLQIDACFNFNNSSWESIARDVVFSILEKKIKPLKKLKWVEINNNIIQSILHIPISEKQKFKIMNNFKIN